MLTLGLNLGSAIFLFFNEGGRESLVRGYLSLRSSKLRIQLQGRHCQFQEGEAWSSWAAFAPVLTLELQPPHQTPGLLAAQKVRTAGKVAQHCSLPASGAPAGL